MGITLKDFAKLCGTYLAAKFHRKCGYTEGYLPRLKKFETEKKNRDSADTPDLFRQSFFERYSIDGPETGGIVGTWTLD